MNRLFLAFAILIHQTYGIAATHPPQEGFIDDDTLVTTGSGNSAGGLKTHQQAETSAKEAARVDAMRKIANLSAGPEPACGVSAEYTQERKNLEGSVRSHKVLHAQCGLISDNPPAQECKVWIQIRMKGLKKILEAPKDDRGQSAGCHP